MNSMKKMGISEIVTGIVFMVLSCIVFFFGKNAIVVGTIFAAIIGIWQIGVGRLRYSAPCEENG